MTKFTEAQILLFAKHRPAGYVEDLRKCATIIGDVWIFDTNSTRWKELVAKYRGGPDMPVRPAMPKAPRKAGCCGDKAELPRTPHEAESDLLEGISA